MPRTTVIRDIVLTAVAAILWWQEAATRHAPGFRPSILGVAAGVSAAVIGFLLHEWGHLAGARITGSFVHYPNRVLAPLLFHFDTSKNDRRQFLAMSYGGYLASAMGTLAIALFAPMDVWSGRVALALAAVGLMVTLAAEVPTTIRVLRGGPLPTGYAFIAPSR